MTEDTSAPRGTTARTPDLNWSQVRETVLMLELAAVQIEAAMKDSNASVEVLTESFTAMAGYMRTISDTLQGLPDTGDTGVARRSLLGVSDHVAAIVHQAIIAFQFYDRLVQRLSHVGESLGGLSELVGDQGRLFNPGEWVALQERIRSRYSMREEVAMFDAVMHGMPVHAAVDQYMDEMKQKGDDVELF